MKRRAFAVGPGILLLACGGKAMLSEPYDPNAGDSGSLASSGSSGGATRGPSGDTGDPGIISGGSSGGPGGPGSRDVDASALGMGSDASAASDAGVGSDANVASDTGGGSDASALSEAGSGWDAGTYDGGACGSASVSFGTDIMPVFRNGCTLSSVCHGQVGNASEEDLYLGDNAGSTSPSVVYQGRVGVRSKEDPSMNLVTSGNLSSSYLWHKVYGDQNSNPAVASGCANAASQCGDCTSSAPCGAMEPYLGGSLPTADLCAIQNWIGQGARNN
ncbi:MAG TPA: hypothetical protein VK762_27595 [Polyangiaceae bacterium]|nr:hypothetical protein [Polyangiaceae bacterium]